MIRQGKYTKKLTPFDKFKRGTKRRWQWFKGLSKPKKALLIGGPILAFLIIIPLATYAYFARDIGNRERLMNRNNTGVVLLDREGEAFYSFGRAERRDLVPLDQIADSTKDALTAAEDRNFYEHGGFSILSTLRALYTNVLLRDATAFGGSTLTQQLAKNTILSDEQTFLRKYQELAVSIAIEREYSKDEILEMYLNSVYYGEGAFGIKDAAETYYDKQPIDLNLAESSMIIGVLPAPGVYSPISGDESLALERQNTVLTRMVNNDMLTEDEKQAALDVELAYALSDMREDGIAPHFAGMVMSELYDRYGEEQVNRSGYRVTTTLDLKLQRRADQSIESHIAYVQQAGGSNISSVAIDPRTGGIRALVGSVDWNDEEFGKVNMATSSRQPGSSFKPVYYAEALANGTITPATILEDVPTDFGGGYSPQNADLSFSGGISVRNALSRSLNIPSVKVMEQLGVSNAVTAAERMGISTLSEDNDYGLSLALGSAETELLEMTNVYAAFGNAGRQYDTTGLLSIDNKFGETIYEYDESSSEVISQEGAFLVSNILSDQNARAPIFGGSLLVGANNQVAVKTGTTDDRRDAWTIGYTPEVAVGVWVGNNDNRTMMQGGSDMAGPVWRGTMQAALEGMEISSFRRPNGIVDVLVCANGQRANRQGPGTYMEVFLATAQPTGSCDVPLEEPEEEDDDEEEAVEPEEPENDEEEDVPPGGEGSE